jgi:hypothetical protein
MLLPPLLALLLPVQLPVPGVTYMPMMPGSHGKPGLVTLGVRPRAMYAPSSVCLSKSPAADHSAAPVLWLVLWAQNLTVAFSDWRLRRSLDGGRSFGPVVDLPNRSEARCLANEDGVMIGDERTHTLHYVVACDDLASSGGRSPDLQVLNSTDGGLSWATPAVNITATTRLSPLRGGAPTSREAYLPAIGGGIQTKSGRLVAQMYGKWCFNDPTGGCNTSGAFSRHGESPNSWAEINHVLYSDDGQTWHTSDVFGVYGAEGSVVELFDGRLLFNYRVDGPMTDRCPDNARVCDTGWGGNITMACGVPSTPGRPAPHHCRGAMFSSNGGETWDDGQGGDGWFGSTIADLPDPGCKGGITRWADKRAIVVSNNQDNGDPGIEQQPRFNLTLSVSTDNGASFPHRKIVYPAHNGKVGYSDVRVTSAGLIAVHFDTQQSGECRTAVEKLCPNMTASGPSKELDACLKCALSPAHKKILRTPTPLPNHPGLMEPPCLYSLNDGWEANPDVFLSEVTGACLSPFASPMDGTLLALVDPSDLLP